MKKVILVVLNNFINDSRVQKEAVSLKDGGYDVKVVALHEGALAEHETIQGVEVHRIKLKSRSWSKNKIVQLFKYVELIYKFVRLYGKADIIHCNDLNTLPLGVVVKTLRNRKAKIVYDAHEYETELNGLHGIHKKITKIAEKMFIGFADKVLTVGNTIAEEYVRLYGIAKPAIILNAPSYKTIEKKNIFRKTFGIREDQTIFLYQGGLTVGRGIEVLLDTFEAMGNDKGVIVFMGYGYLDKLIKEKAEKNNNIFFHPAVTPDVLLNYTSSADFGISTIEDCSLSDRYSLPNKMFEYLMVELPVIVSNLPEMKKFVQDSGIGVVVKNNNVNGVKEACQDAMGMDKAEIKENLKKAKEIYNWEEQEKILLKVYSEV